MQLDRRIPLVMLKWSCFSGLATALGCLVGDILDNRKTMECIAYTGREAANVISALDVNPIELFGLRPILENVSFETREELDKVIDYWTKIQNGELKLENAWGNLELFEILKI